MGHIVFREESWGPEATALDPIVDPHPETFSVAPRSEYFPAHVADEEAEDLACRWCGGELAEGLSLSGARRCLTCGKGTRAIDMLGEDYQPIVLPEPPERFFPDMTREAAVCGEQAECGAPCALPPGHPPPCVGSCGPDCPA